MKRVRHFVLWSLLFVSLALNVFTMKSVPATWWATRLARKRLAQENPPGGDGMYDVGKITRSTRWDVLFVRHDGELGAHCIVSVYDNGTTELIPGY